MKRKLLQALLGLLLLACSKITLAQTYYVDGSQAVNGNGSLASPWNDFRYAVWATPQAQDSDVTVYFRRGTYSFNYSTGMFLYVGSNKSALNGYHFNLEAYPGEQVVFDGSGLTTNWGSMVVADSVSNLRLKGLTFANIQNMTGFGIDINGTSSNIAIDSCSFRNMMWNTDTAEANYPASGSAFVAPVYIDGTYGGTPGNIYIDSSLFATVAPGYQDSLVERVGTVGTVTEIADVDSNIYWKKARTQFYVSTTGSDTTGDGSFSHPWKTPRYAINTAGYDWSTGSPVLVDSNIAIILRNGTYYLDTSLYIGSNRGGNGKWTALTAYPGEYPTLDGGNLTQKFSCIIIIDSASYININGLNLQNLTDDSTLTTVGGGDTVKDTRYGISVSRASSHITIQNNDLYNMKWTRDTTKAKNPEPNDVLSAITVLGNSNTPVTDLYISNNTIHNIVPGYAEGMTMNGNVDSFTIIGNEVYDVANIGICAAGNYKWVLQQYPSLLKANNQSRNGLIQDNSVYRCISPIATSAGIYLDGSLNVTVKGNECYNDGTGISVGNEQDSSTSGGHTIISNNFWSNLGPAMYLGSNNSTSTCSNVTVKYNTDSNDWTINPTLYARANGRYGTLDSSGQGPELIMQLIQNLTVDENDVYSTSNKVLEFAFSQSGLVFTYNDYYTHDNNPCKAYFYRDTVGNGLAFKTDTTFNQYGRETGLDTTSYLGGVAYNRHGCGTSGSSVTDAAVSTAGARFGHDSTSIYEYPNPVVSGLYLHIQSGMSGPAALELFDVSGRMLLRQDVQLAAGANDIGWPDVKQQGVTAGVYILRLLTGSEGTTTKVVIQ